MKYRVGEHSFGCRAALGDLLQLMGVGNVAVNAPLETVATVDDRIDLELVQGTAGRIRAAPELSGRRRNGSAMPVRPPQQRGELSDGERFVAVLTDRRAAFHDVAQRSRFHREVEWRKIDEPIGTYGFQDGFGPSHTGEPVGAAVRVAVPTESAAGVQEKIGELPSLRRVRVAVVEEVRSMCKLDHRAALGFRAACSVCDGARRAAGGQLVSNAGGSMIVEDESPMAEW